MQGLEDLYREIILDHYKNPRNSGTLESPPALKNEGYNPLCGDEVTIYVNWDGDKIADIKMAGQGCSISRSSASLMTISVKGKSLEEARGVIKTFKSLLSLADDHETVEIQTNEDLRALGELAALQGVVKFPVRIKCATLAWNTFSQILDEIDATI
ncbi:MULTISPECIES: Fe-S cluster assembly sulfur transfer protein SufU [Acidithrix]|uniref:Zinc-dependent sulfurtransferase SufU n=1 Tax=Acidithrix ferrooxidans TaxID=1280514 RepID=A0A0D8HIX5_9ACTN|nr:MULTISPECIES: SUF system NifU family Fe-S cluster assembly protein [Acidithrix]KJF17819.1 zinc-dependent sulfurtransferase SufU [Acidithrix ferrooxidans]CAG4925101.1 unnamed protein product [Acidithrix sp. C25]